MLKEIADWFLVCLVLFCTVYGAGSLYLDIRNRWFGGS